MGSAFSAKDLTNLTLSSMNFVTGNPYPTNSFDEPQQPIAAVVVIKADPTASRGPPCSASAPRWTDTPMKPGMFFAVLIMMAAVAAILFAILHSA
jgi:hypothetical protein